MSDMVPEVLNAALDSLFTPKEPGEQEYQGEDGLLYCRNCHTPVQCRVKLWGRDKIVPCLCRYLTEEKFVPLSTTDEYFQVPDYGETYPLSVRGQTILLDSCSLAVALAELPEQTQEEIFLYYFQHLTQKEIGEQSGWTRSTIGRHIQLALKRLKEEMEVLSHE